MTLRDYSSSDLVRQPIGYWSGHAYRTVVGRIRADLALEGLIQPTWWILNHVDGAPNSWTQGALTDRLGSFDDQDTDFDEEFDDLRQRGLLEQGPSGTLRLTENGREVLSRARERSATALAVTMNGVDDDEYVAALNVLRRIVHNLGADSDLP